MKNTEFCKKEFLFRKEKLFLKIGKNSSPILAFLNLYTKPQKYANELQINPLNQIRLNSIKNVTSNQRQKPTKIFHFLNPKISQKINKIFLKSPSDTRNINSASKSNETTLKIAFKHFPERKSMQQQQKIDRKTRKSPLKFITMTSFENPLILLPPPKQKTIFTTIYLINGKACVQDTNKSSHYTTRKNSTDTT